MAKLTEIRLAKMFRQGLGNRTGTIPFPAQVQMAEHFHKTHGQTDWEKNTAYFCAYEQLILATLSEIRYTN